MANTQQEVPSWQKARARIGLLTAAHASQEEIDQARAEYNALFKAHKIAELIASAPELSDEQRRRLAALLGGGAS